MKDDKRIATDQVHVGIRRRAFLRDGQGDVRQPDAPAAGLEPAGKDLASWSPTFLVVEQTPASRGYLAEEARCDLMVVRQVDLGVTVKSTGDFVVEQQDGVIPPIDELREMRERQAFHLHARLHRLAATLCRDQDRDVLDGGAVDGRLAGENGGESAVGVGERQMALPGGGIEDRAATS